MKGLAKLLTPLLFAGGFALPSIASAQQISKKLPQEFIPQTSWSAELGVYGDEDSNISERYAPIWGGAGRVIRDFSNNFRGELAAGFYGGNGDFKIQGYDVQGSFSMTFAEGALRYKSGSWSWGAGPILLNVRERLSASGESAAESGTGIGLILGSTYDIDLGGGTKFPLKFEYLSMLTGPNLSGIRLSIGFQNLLPN